MKWSVCPVPENVNRTRTSGNNKQLQREKSDFIFQPNSIINIVGAPPVFPSRFLDF